MICCPGLLNELVLVSVTIFIYFNLKQKPSFTNRESSLKSGITDYLDLIEDDNNEMTKNEGVSNESTIALEAGSFYF